MDPTWLRGSVSGWQNMLDCGQTMAKRGAVRMLLVLLCNFSYFLCYYPDVGDILSGDNASTDTDAYAISHHLRNIISLLCHCEAAILSKTHEILIAAPQCSLLLIQISIALHFFVRSLLAQR